MKRMIPVLLALALCLSLSAALADEADASPFFHTASFRAEDIDVSGVQAVGDRLVGVVKLPAETVYGLPAAALYVDCPLPQDLTDDQRATLYVTRKALTKRDLSAAMKAIGQNPGKGELAAYASVQTLVSYSSEANIDFAYYHAQLHDAALSHDPAYAAQYAQARDTARSLIEALGGSVCESVLHANRRDAAHNDPYSLSESSTSAEMSAKRRAHFEESEARAGRTVCDITMVRGLYALRGLPVMDQFYDAQEDGWVGYGSEFRAAVRDDGTLCFAAVEGLPVITRAEPLDLPALDWQVLLKNAIVRLFASNAIPADETLEDGSVRYAGYAVITALAPCYVGLTADTLVPGWYCVTEDRMASDDSVAAVWGLYGDAQTLMAE